MIRPTKYLAAVTLTIVAGELPYVMSIRMVWTWVAVQSAVLAALLAIFFGWIAAVSGGCAYAAFSTTPSVII